MRTMTCLRRALLVGLSLILLLSAFGCIGRADDPEDTLLSGTRPAETAAGDPATAPPDTEPGAPDTPEETDTEAVTDAETQPDTQPTGPEAGAIRFIDPTALKKCKPARLSTKVETDADGISYLACRVKAADPWFVLADSEKTAVTGAQYLRIRYRTSVNIQGRLYLGESQIGDGGALPVNYVCDGEWHTLELDLGQSATYAQTLGAIRYDPMDGTDPDNEAIDIAWIGLYPPMTGDPTENLPELPEDVPDLSDYEQPEHTDGRPTYYRASNYLTADKGGDYTFKEGFTLDIYRRGYFNRYTVAYYSTAPLKGEITYLMWDENGERVEKTETFFLEAGDNKVFNSLIDDYARSKYAWGMERITLSTCDGSVATFHLTSLGDTTWEVYPGTYYIENDRYKLGVMLSWGGGISYIEDKQDGDKTLKNLINRADPGRLVQQSYYGIKDGPNYEAGMYGTTLWRYNPVQGGDLYGNPSKLVDVRLSEDGQSMYIKCRPMDWAKNGELTPSYMENTYTLSGGAILVDNRFVDFFGVKHDAHHFELPAFYTVSYLGVFHYYNGTKPWTGDAYTSLPNEPFWAGNGDAYHTIKSGNTETWAAWTSTEGYGIGVYTPGVEILLAGRHEHNGSKDPANGGTSYVAPIRTLEIVSYQPFEYSYVIAAGTVEEMREVFKTYADGQ